MDKENKIAVIVEHEDGKVYQVALSKHEIDAIATVLIALHDGRVKVISKPLDIVLNSKD